MGAPLRDRRAWRRARVVGRGEHRIVVPVAADVRD